jgi:hypothetical protein
MNALRIAACCLLLSAFSSAADFKTEVTSDAAFKRLQTVKQFAFGGVGFAGRISQGELDFRRIIKQAPDKALADFERLYSTGTPETKAYALAAIKKLKADRFSQLVASAKSSPEMVETMRGCIVSREPLGTIAQQIDSGKFVIP